MPYPYYNPYFPTQNNYQQAQAQQTQQGLIPVRSFEEVLNYPIAPGVSLTFKDETLPYIYTKTMGLSQFDRPIVEKYRYEKENAEQENTSILDEIASIKTRLDLLERPKGRPKKEVVIDE